MTPATLPMDYVLTFVPAHEQLALMSVPTIHARPGRANLSPGPASYDAMEAASGGGLDMPGSLPGVHPGGSDPQDRIDLIEVMDRPEPPVMVVPGARSGVAPGAPIPVRQGMIPLADMPRFIAAYNAGYSHLTVDLDAASQAMTDGTGGYPVTTGEDELDDTLWGIENA